MEKKILYSRSHRLRFDNFVLPLKHFNKAQTILCFKNPRKTVPFSSFLVSPQLPCVFYSTTIVFFFYFSDFFEVNEADNRWIHDDEKRN